MLSTALRSFHAVARYGGFSAAARALNISQPTLSTQVKALEARYRTPLFIRQGRDTRLTAEGQELFQTTLRLHQSENEAEELLNAFKGLESGSLTIAAVGPFHAIEVVVAFKARHPNIDVDVQFGNSRQSFDRLLAYEADIGLIAEMPADDRVVALPYRTHEVVVFVNSAHPFFGRDTISIAELEGQTVIQREVGSTTRKAMEGALAAHGTCIDVMLDLGSREGVWMAVEQGLGIGFVADFEFVAHPNLRMVRIHDAKIITRYYLAFLRERRASRMIEAFCAVAPVEGEAP